mgnify:FL=1
MKTKVLKTIREYNLIEDKDNIVVGVSGGPDSMTLLYVLLDIKKEIHMNIYVAHVNHGVRGKEADEDEEYVRKISKSLGLPFYSKRIDMEGYAKENKLSSEEAGRKLRYEFFREILSSVGGGKIAVAHNKNDQAETLLMRFLRGTGIDGLKGMEYKKGDIIRPLLDISRKEIEAYVSERHIQTRLDKTNLEPIYNRNKIRLELIPYIEKNFNPNIIETLSRTSKVMMLDSSFLEDYSWKIYYEIVKVQNESSIILDKGLFLKQDKSIMQRVIRNSILKINGSLQGFTERHISDIVNLFKDNTTGKSIDLLNGIVAKTSYDRLIIEKGQNVEKKSLNYKLNIGGTTNIEEFNLSLETTVLPIEKFKINFNNRFIKYFDYDKIEGNLFVRNRLKGDKFVPFGMKGKKKLKDLFIDEKVPKEDRDTIPLIADEENIIWVVGFRTSELYKITASTKNVLAIKYYNNYII